MRREVRGSGFHHAVAEGREIQALEHRLALSEQDRRKREVQFIDQAGLQILANCRDATSNLDVTCSRGVACALESGVDPVRDRVVIALRSFLGAPTAVRARSRFCVVVKRPANSDRGDGVSSSPV